MANSCPICWMSIGFINQLSSAASNEENRAWGQIRRGAISNLYSGVVGRSKEKAPEKTGALQKLRQFKRLTWARQLSQILFTASLLFPTVRPWMRPILPGLTHLLTN